MKKDSFKDKKKVTQQKSKKETNGKTSAVQKEKHHAVGKKEKVREKGQPKRKTVPQVVETVKKAETVEKVKPLIAEVAETGITPKEIAEKVGQPVSKVIAELIKLGVIVSPEQLITDHDTIVLVFSAFNYEVKFEKPKITTVIQPQVVEKPPKVEKPKEIKPEEVKPVVKKEIPPNWVKKIPVVTVMGHVDHGKTTLLDTIMKTDIAAKEYGAITQHIGAYKVSTSYGDITFIDTPGHEAFSSLRARGAKVTDIVVLVVAGDEGIMPQTIESLNHAKSASLPIIVAINKIDLPQCNVNSVKQQFADMGIIPEEWGGDTKFVEISAKKNINVDKLLQAILTLTDTLELYVPIDVPCEATVIETKLDDKRGFVATLIVNKGKLKVGDSFVCGMSYGKVRAMFNERGQRITELFPGEPAEVIGFEKPATAGDLLKVVSSEKEARRIYEELEREAKLSAAKKKAFKTIEDIILGKSNVLSLVIKTDTQGSAEAIQKMLNYLVEETKNDPNLPRLKIVNISVGEITESDILLATASQALVIGFNVRPDTQALKRAKIDGVEIRTYRIIYELVDDVKKIIHRLKIKEEVEEVLGRARVKKVFDISQVGKVAGCIVEMGKIVRNAKARLLRDNKILVDTRIKSLKQYKEDVKEVQQGYECGICLENFQDIKEDDIIECYQIVTKEDNQ